MADQCVGMDHMETKDWLANGNSRRALDRAIADGEILRLRRGRILTEPPHDPSEIHRARVDAAVSLLRQGTFVSHRSAAILHGLPLWVFQIPDLVHVTRTGGGHGYIGTVLHAHQGKLDPGHRTTIDEIPVTSLDRTAADVIRELGLLHGVAVADVALALGVPRDTLYQLVASGRGSRAARAAVDFADPRAESPGESYSRALMRQFAIRPPTGLQHELFDASGGFAGRVDFWWEEEGVVGEFDGLGKYTRLLKPGQSPEDVIRAEKARESNIRDLGYDVVRWITDDLWRPRQFIRALERALRRGSARSRRPC